MRYAFATSCFALILFLPAAAWPSDKSTTEDVPTPFDSDGYSVTANTAPNSCLIGSNIDLKMMIAQVSDLQTRGLVPPDVNATNINSQAWTTAATIAFKLQPLLVAIVFNSQPALTHCAFMQSITGLDGKKHPTYGFDLTRAEFAKTNWKSLGPGELPNVTSHFKVFKESSVHLSAENK